MKIIADRINVARVLLCLLALQGLARAGVVMENVETDVAAGKVEAREIVMIQNGALRVETGKDRKLDSIEIYKAGNFYTLDPATKTYTVSNAQVMQARRARMQAQIAKMPPERRAAMEKAMGVAANAQVKFEYLDTGKSEKSGAYTCRVWRETLNKTSGRELCVVPAGSIAGGAEVVALYRDLSANMSKALAGMGAANASFPDLSKMNGVPVLTRDFTAGKLDTETRLVGVRTEAIPTDRFEIPKGYRLESEEDDDDEDGQ